MAVEPQSNDDVFGEEFEDEYYDELKRAVLRRSPEENVEKAREHIVNNWHRHGDEDKEEVQMILALLLNLASHAPAEFHHEGRVAKGVKVGPTIDLGKFEVGYRKFSEGIFTEDEKTADLLRFREELLKLPYSSLTEEGIFGGATRQAVRDIFTPIFGETVNGEDLAFELRKHLERSFI